MTWSTVKSLRSSCGEVELRRTLGVDERRDKLVEVSRHHLVELVQRELDPVVGNPVLLEVVGADLFRPSAAANHAAPLCAGGRLLLGKFHVVEASAKDAESLLPVLQLRLLVLHAHHQPGRLMRHPDRGVCRVDALSAGSGGGRCLDLEVLWFDFDLDRVGLRHHRDSGGGRMDTSLGLGLWHALHAMHATLVFQERIGALPVYLEHDLVESPMLARRDVDNLDLPALALGPFRVHTEKVGREEGRLLPTLRTLDLDHDVPIVVWILGQKENLELLIKLPDLRQRPVLFCAQVFLHLLIFFLLEHRSRGFQLVARGAICVVRLDDVPYAPLLAGELRELGVVHCHVGPTHLRFDLVVSTRDRVEPIDHAAAPAVSSSPWRALLNAVMATSSMSSEGSRVVNFCVPSTGSSKTRTTGLWRWRAMKRMSSKPAPAISGMASTRLATSQNQFGWNSATTLNTITLTTSTTSKNPVPHRGCSRLARRTDGMSSGHPDSNALMVLCSAPWYWKTRRTSGNSAMAVR